MDFGFETGISDFDVDVEEVETKKVKKYERLWQVMGGGSIYQKPTLHEGVMYFGAMDSYVYSVNAETGVEIWRTKLDGPVLGSCPAIHGDVLYIGSYGYDFYAMDRNTGKILWKFRTSGEVMSTPAVRNDMIYFCSGDGYAYCLGLEGNLIWRFRTGDKIASSPAVYEGKVVFGSFDNNYYCLDAETGKELWRFRTGAEVWHCNPVLIKNGRVYGSSFDDNVYCLDLNTGSEIWRFKTGKYGSASAPVEYDGLIYHSCRDGIVYCLSTEGKEIWRFRAGEISDAASFHNGIMFFGNGDGYFYALDAKTGKEVWRFSTGSINYNLPTIWNGKIYFSSWDCHIYAITLEGKEVWRFTSSNTQESQMPPAYDAWKTEIKKQSTIDETVSEDRYKSKKEDSVSLSDYHVTSEYATTSEYKQKSDYDTSFVMFEDVLEGEELWISISVDLRPQNLMQK